MITGKSQIRVNPRDLAQPQRIRTTERLKLSARLSLADGAFRPLSQA